ncbi:MAG: MBL fold metallo-hydrolase [Acidimicrobiia bacterium]|nr:MBL fold metallo-hydrolase [Acidimicrobiia bacterium]
MNGAGATDTHSSDTGDGDPGGDPSEHHDHAHGHAHEHPTRDAQGVRQERQPASTEIVEVAPGVLRLQLDISFPGLGHVNCYAMEDERGVALVDPGLPGRNPWRDLQARLKSAGLPLQRVHTVIATHSHPDHYGAAAHLRAETGAEVVTHENFKTFWDPDEEDDEEKYLAGPDDLDGWAAAKERLVRWGRDRFAGGLPDFNRPTPWGGKHPGPDRRTRVRYRTEGMLLRRYFQPPRPSTRVQDGESIRLGRTEWLAVHTPGHTVDHLCLLDPANGTLISGDHVLPTITPHISGLVRADDPLALFMASLQKVADIDGIRCVLPAHGHPFSDLPGRTASIIEHHHERLQKLHAAAADLGAATVEEFSQRLFVPRSWGPMADSETFAHLEHLRLAGLATRHKQGDQLIYEVEPAR